MTAGDVLRAAIVELKARGWCQGELVEDDGSMCAIGAIECVATDMLEATIAEDALRVYGIGDPAVSIADWNDEPTRTATEVRAAFEIAAVLADAALDALWERLDVPALEKKATHKNARTVAAVRA